MSGTVDLYFHGEGCHFDFTQNALLSPLEVTILPYNDTCDFKYHKYPSNNNSFLNSGKACRKGALNAAMALFTEDYCLTFDWGLKLIQPHNDNFGAAEHFQAALETEDGS